MPGAVALEAAHHREDAPAPPPAPSLAAFSACPCRVRSRADYEDPSLQAGQPSSWRAQLMLRGCRPAVASAPHHPAAGSALPSRRTRQARDSPPERPSPLPDRLISRTKRLDRLESAACSITKTECEKMPDGLGSRLDHPAPITVGKGRIDRNTHGEFRKIYKTYALIHQACRKRSGNAHARVVARESVQATTANARFRRQTRRPATPVANSVDRIDQHSMRT